MNRALTCVPVDIIRLWKIVHEALRARKAGEAAFRELIDDTPAAVVPAAGGGRDYPDAK